VSLDLCLKKRVVDARRTEVEDGDRGVDRTEQMHIKVVIAVARRHQVSKVLVRGFLALAAAGGDPEPDGQIGPGGGFAGKQRFSPLDDGVWIFQESGVLVAILDAIMDRLVDLGLGVLVEADDLQSRMILAEPAPDSVTDIDNIVFLLPGRRKIAPAKVFAQGLKPGPGLF
jgi:hypothetical protein